MAKQVRGTDTSQVLKRLDGASNVLISAPSFGRRMTSLCHDLVVSSAGDSAVIGVTYTQSPQSWASGWESAAGRAPDRGAVIGVGDYSVDDGNVDTDRWTLETIENAGDLTGLGIALSDVLAEFDEATDGRPRLCFDSLTALLQYVDLDRAFQFLHAVTGRVESTDTVGHYHVEPQAHDEQALATIKGLFDAAVETDDGEWQVRTR